VLLAINSKNNAEDALAIIDKHPEMVLKRDDFVAMYINWTDKATKMRHMAAELNLGVNSFILIDDSPVERALMRHALPEILVPEFPDQIADLPYILDHINDLDYDSFTETDRQRTQMYKTESLRLEMKKDSATVEDYLAMLETQVTIAAAGEADFGRLEQMFQRTNQFNLTNKRYGTAELQSLSTSADHAVVLANMRDKFGDLGIIATAILAFNTRAMVDSFLMSCRVIGRGVETAILAHLAKLALARGYDELYGAFVRSSKNTPSQRLYLEHGFEPWGQEGNAEILVLRGLSEASIVVPNFIAVKC
jgi:FkbH-like protein